MSMASRAALVDALLVASLGDWLPEVTALYEARQINQGVDRKAAIEAVTSAVSDLLREGFVRVGSVTEDGFHAWPEAAEALPALVRSTWIDLARDPYPGELFWLELTEAGRERAELLWNPPSANG
jgi:hypothetical protein